MAKAYTTYGTKQTSQHQPIVGREKEMVQNNAGGYTFAVNDWTRLDRFIILGSEGGTYYVNAKELTKQNAECVLHCIQLNGERTVDRIVELSESGRAPKNDPALFALALASKYGDNATRKAAYAALPRVGRIGTHLFHFVQYREQFGGWSRGLRGAIANWYESKTPSDLAYQAVKYQQRDGWSHRDLLRLAHPKTDNATRNTIYHWMVKGWDGVGDEPHPEKDLQFIWAFEKAKTATKSKEIVSLIADYNLPREAIPTQFLTEKDVWDALLVKMPMEAMIRNLATMTRVGLLVPLSDAVNTIRERLANADYIKKSRLHPIKVLAALKTYEQGHGERGQNSWTPVPAIVDALNDAFYTSFGNVTPTGKNFLFGVDVSGSMTYGTIAGMEGITPNIAATAMAMVTAKVEKNYHIMGFADSFRDLGVTANMRLDQAMEKTSGMSFGGTDCALPMLWAIQHKAKVDTFVVLTDNETWFNEKLHPVQALQQYRQKMGIPAKLVVAGMTSTNFTIADPSDGGSLDVVGFDTATPELISDFAVN